MERWQVQENLSHLVNIEALLGKLSGSRPIQMTNIRQENSTSAAPSLFPHELKWPREAVSSNLHSRLNERFSQNGHGSGENTLRVLPISSVLGIPASKQSSAQDARGQLNELLETFVNDVLASRDKLLMLNPGRRKMIEHRLEFIARKIARSRGERLNRSLSLPEILRESYRDVPLASQATSPAPKLGIAAWRGFVLEVALYNLLQLSFLKCLDLYRWRDFEPADLGRMNFAAHTFLSQRASGFAHDKHCWNFVRTNLYSWYVPSQKGLGELARKLEGVSFSWSDLELQAWITELPPGLKPSHLEFAEEAKVAVLVGDLLDKQLSAPVTSNFQGRVVCKKFFIPALELGGVSLQVLDRLLGDVRRGAPDAFDGGIIDESSQLHRALWACESESFEAFWTEVLALLKVLRMARSSSDFSLTTSTGIPMDVCPFRLPQAMHVVQSLGLELHNMDQLPLGSPEVSKMQQGSAAQIQQIESFDFALVNDHPDRAKSAAWMKALAQQLPYWRTLVSAGTNLNWGELHLYLGMSKLKENGLCVYLSHRTLPEGGDGEKLRKGLLNLSTLEYFVELSDEDCRPYRYLYIFRRVSKKADRDVHRPRFGQKKTSKLELSSCEEASSTQAEIAERGWDHLFVRGAAPLVRHLNHKFPKLFQLASIQTEHQESMRGLFAGTETKAIQVMPDAEGAVGNGAGLCFQPICGQAPARDSLLIFPHNPVDLPWISAILNSAPAQFWIRHQVVAMSTGANRQPRFLELRSCPIVDLSHAPSDLVHESLEWLGVRKPDLAGLRAWAVQTDAPVTVRYAKFVALAKRYASLERIVARYQPLFSNKNFEELRPEAVTQFYPASLLCHISQSPDIRIQYAERGRSSLLPENWAIDEIHTITKEVSGKRMAFVVIQTRQGPVIQILVPLAIRDYFVSQLRQLRNHTWGEALAVVRLPRDINLFSAQVHEITRVVCDTAREMSAYRQTIDELALELFEIPIDMRQFLTR